MTIPWDWSKHGNECSRVIVDTQYAGDLWRDLRPFGEWVSIFIDWLNQSIIINELLLIIIDYIDCNQWLMFIDWYRRARLRRKPWQGLSTESLFSWPTVCDDKCTGLLTNTPSNMILSSKISKSHLGTQAFRLKLLQRHKTKATKECFFSDSAARLSVLRTYSVSNLPVTETRLLI